MDVQFDEPEYDVPRPVVAPKKRGPLMSFLIKRKWAKDEAASQRILLGVIIVVVVITGAVLASQFRFSSPAPLLPADPSAGTP